MTLTFSALFSETMTFSINRASPGAAVTTTYAKADTLNYHQFGGPITLDLTKSVQTVNGTSMLTLADPEVVANVVGPDYDNLIRGNARDNTLIGGGGQSTLIAGTGLNNVLEGAISQVIYLDFDTFTGPSIHQYTASERGSPAGATKLPRRF